MTVRRTLRLLRVCWAMDIKHLSESTFFVLITVLQPLIFSSIAFFMFRAGGEGGTLLYAAFGAGLMGIWSATLFGSGGLIQWERFQGTLELLVVTPPPFVMVLVPSTLATSTVGVYAIGATLLWGKLFFGMPIDVVHPLWLAVSIPATVFSLGLMGLMLASTFVLYRHANALSNLLEYPVWLVTGLLVPVSLLPAWAEPISWVLAPYWGMNAVRDSAFGGDPGPDVLMALLLGLTYFVIGAVFLQYFERRARERATLALT